MKPRAIYSGDTFRNLMRNYSFDRMKIDPAYRQAVYAAIERRKAEQAAQREAQRDAANATVA